MNPTAAGPSYRDLLARYRQPAPGPSPLRSSALGALYAPPQMSTPTPGGDVGAAARARYPQASTMGYGSAPAAPQSAYPPVQPTASAAPAAPQGAGPTPPPASGEPSMADLIAYSQAHHWYDPGNFDWHAQDRARNAMRDEKDAANRRAEQKALIDEAMGYNQAAIGDQTRHASRNFSEEMAARGLSGSGLETAGLSSLYGHQGAELGQTYLQGVMQKLGLLGGDENFSREMALMALQGKYNVDAARAGRTGHNVWGDIVGGAAAFAPYFL